MKYISFAIPCYNSAAYMDRAVESILKGGEDVEIIIVNDGSKDDTSKIAHEYEEKYPTIVRAVDKENGGHGDAVNAGLDHAEGKYFKVVDSDDWVDEEALYKILDVLKKFEEEEKQVDMLLANYVYEKEGMEHKKVIEYKNVLPQEEIFGWNDVKHFHLGQYILMHSVIYRTDFLKLCQLRLPKHTFYVDNLFAFEPLPYVKNLYYLDVNFYRYFIGRDDQSVNEKVMIKRIDQQIRVNKLMVDAYINCKSTNKQLKAYMFSYLDIITTISSIMLIRANTEESLQKKKELLEYIRTENKQVYRKLRHSLFGRVMNLPGRSGRKMSVAAYKISQKFYGFN